MEENPLEVVGRQYDLATGTEKLITQDGRTIEVPGELCPEAQKRAASESSGRTEVVTPPADLEAQK